MDQDPGGERTHSTPEVPTPAQLKARLRRLEVLRGAARALSPSTRSNEIRQHFDDAAIAQEIRTVSDLVRELESGRGSAAEAAERLSRVDGALLAQGRMLRELADEIPLVQLRATLPGIATRRRFDVVALLDVLIQDQNGVLERAILFDYLITLLSIEERGGVRCVSCDPVALTPRLKRMCERAQSMYGEQSRSIEQEFYTAASPERPPGDLETTIAAMRRRKNSLGQLVFVPGVLRAIVTYNAAVANWIEQELVASKRRSEEEILGFELGAGDDPELEAELSESYDWAGSAEADAANAGSVFDSAAVAAIDRAVLRRCRGERLGTEAAERIAARLRLEDLSEEERAHLTAGDERVARVIRLTIVVGLIMRSMLESTLDLRELGVDPDVLREDWPRELDRALKEVVSERISGDAYKEACALSDLKTRFLYESVSTVARRTREARPRPADPDAAQVDPGQLRDIARQARSRQAAEAAAEEQPGWRRGLDKLRPALMAAAGVTLMCLAVLNVVRTPQASIRYMSPMELHAVSPYLVSGYRDAGSGGRLFVGTLGPSWDQLDDAARARAAREMVAVMNAAGASEFMAFDAVRRMRVQGAGGVVRFPQPPRGS